MSFTTLIGIIASVFTGISLLPQLIKLLREKKASDISMLMLVTLFAGLACWIWYGIQKNDWVIILSNAVSLCLNITIFSLNLYFRKKQSSQKDTAPHFDTYAGLGEFIEEKENAGT